MDPKGWKGRRQAIGRGSWNELIRPGFSRAACAWPCVQIETRYDPLDQVANRAHSNGITALWHLDALGFVMGIEPGDSRGTSMLLIENEDRFDDIYLYLPSLGTIRNVASSQRPDALFCIDVSYQDLKPKTADAVEVR